MKNIQTYKLSFLLIIFFLTTHQNISMQVSAWSFEVHEEVAVQAAELLPEPWKTFLLNNISELKEASIYPDDIAKANDPYEGPRHFDDSDIPHQDRDIDPDSDDYKLGVISWTIEIATQALTDALKTGDDAEIIFRFGVLSHYATDSSQPLHATSNFNGQLTGNDGIHSTFEASLIKTFWNDIFANISVLAPKIVDPYSATKSIIASGLALVPALLEADTKARQAAVSSGGGQSAYFNTFYSEIGKIAIDRISLAIQHTANLWYTAIKNVEPSKTKNTTSLTSSSSPSVSSATTSASISNIGLSIGLFTIVVLKVKQKKIIKFR